MVGKKNEKLAVVSVACLALALAGCGTLPFTAPQDTPETKSLIDNPVSTPESFPIGEAGPTSAVEDWHAFFTDERLVGLIESALENNQELRILLQEIEIARAEVLRRRGAYLPFITLGAGADLEKVGKNTRNGAVEEELPLGSRRHFRDPLPNYRLAAEFSWEVDVWKKLRNEKKAAVMRFLGTQEGRNYTIINLVAEIASTYYELMALDNQVTILSQMIEVQRSALETVRLEKQAARVTELAVQRFVAEVTKNESRLFLLKQQIVVTENLLNYLVGRYPQPIDRASQNFETLALDPVRPGSPADLLMNRPDVRQAELELEAAKLDVKAARAQFYPRLDIAAAVGLDSFSLTSLFMVPESILYNVAADLMVPLVNRSQIRAAYNGASAAQIAAVFRYRQVVLNAYIEVVNQFSQITNINQSYDLKERQVAALSEAIDVASLLFRSARADYTEVLLTQRDALESRMELVELKQQQASAVVRAYRALGGGYRREAAKAGQDG